MQAVLETNRAQDVLDWEEFLMLAFAFESSLTAPNPFEIFGTDDFSHSKLNVYLVVEENTLHSPSVPDFCSHCWLN